MGDRASSLSISSAGLSNAGNYTCVAQNSAGMDYHSAYLEVNGTNMNMTIVFVDFFVNYWLLFILFNFNLLNNVNAI